MIGRIFILLLCTYCSAAVNAKELPTAKPKQVGMSSERLDYINKLAQKYVVEGKIAGLVTMVAREGKIVHFEAAGSRGVDDKRPVEKDSLFRIYSMSKPITSVALMMLYEEGKFQLKDPVSKFIPELSKLSVMTEDGKLVDTDSDMTIQQLMTHTAGFSYDFHPDEPVSKLYKSADLFKSKDLDEFVLELAKLPLKNQPGKNYHYSVSVDVMGLLVQRLSGIPFDQYLSQNIFEPLSMKDTFFNVPEEKYSRFLPNHDWDKDKQKIVRRPDSNGRYKSSQLFSGGGGLVSTAMDYMRFAEMMRRGGSLDGKRILSPKTIQFMTQDHLSGMDIPSPYETKGFGFGLGFHIEKSATSSGLLNSEGTYSWGGAAGTIFWIDPVEEIVVVTMIQLRGSPWPLGSEMRVLVNQAITQLK